MRYCGSAIRHRRLKDADWLANRSIVRGAESPRHLQARLISQCHDYETPEQLHVTENLNAMTM